MRDIKGDTVRGLVNVQDIKGYTPLMLIAKFYGENFAYDFAKVLVDCLSESKANNEQVGRAQHGD